MSVSADLARLASLAGHSIATPAGYVAALLLPTALLAIGDWLVRRRRP